MGRGRAKGRRFSTISQEEGGSGEEEKIPVQKRRGRPHKPLKDEEIDEEEFDEKAEQEDETEDSNKEVKSVVQLENGKKRKRSSFGKEKLELGKSGNGFGNDTEKKKGFRQNGSRRKKGKPCRAAEAGVMCN